MRTALVVLLLLIGSWSPVSASRLEHGRTERVTGMAGARDRARVLLELARTLDADRPVEALAQRRTALHFAEQSKDLELMHRVLVELRRNELDAGGLDGVLKASLRAPEVSQQLERPAVVATDLAWLSRTYAELGQPVRAMEESQRALLVVRSLGDSLRLAMAHLDVMERMIAAGRFREAQEQGHLADVVFAHKVDVEGQARRWVLSATALLDQGKAADALPCLGKAATLLGRSASPALWTALRKEQARAALGMGDMRDADRHLDSLEVLLTRTGDRSERLHYLDLRQQLARALGAEREALTYLDLQMKLKDSLLNAQMARQLAGLQALYQVSSKDRDNAMLRERSAMNEAIAGSAQRRNRLLLILLGVVSAMVVLFGTTLFHVRRVIGRVRHKNRLIREQGEQLQTQNLELQRQNARLARSLMAENEKDLMLREIHHRVKNDLQVVSTLVRLRALHEPSSGSREALEDLERRVQAMALVHDRLYRSNDLRHIGLGDHLQELASGVVRSFAAEPRVAATVSCTMAEVPTTMLIPLGLLVNELVMNSLKHGFPEGRHGSIRIQLDQWNVSGLRLRYEDDGVGLATSNGLSAGSFGHDLIHALSEQLEGELRMSTGEGHRVELLATLGEAPLRAVG
ncbi:MAG: sensor histidine kinase [Flavobacteriales bacterium]|nr:sensor histidine kinase [Flavobacteriales bacterium]